MHLNMIKNWLIQEREPNDISVLFSIIQYTT